MAHDDGVTYEAPAVEDLGTLSAITAGAGVGMRDSGTNDGAGKT